MKNKLKLFGMLILFISIILAFSLSACGSGDPNTATVTVTFNSNGGSTITSQTFNHGEKAIKPTDPTRTFIGAITHFRGWYTDNNTFANAFNFDTAITSNIDLYADWGYRPGDTGPGGGKIFYRLEAGFTQYANAADTVGTKAYYLEAAPANMSRALAWASSGYTSTNISGTGTAIGTGRKNTAVILAVDANAPAAKACKDYSGGGKADWFLPSKDELNELYVSRASVGVALWNYWSSSQDRMFNLGDAAWSQYFLYGDQHPDLKGVGNDVNVRAVRAF
jgi:hypothetical protein